MVTNNTNAALFSAGPAVASNGTLTYTPAANAFGTATITLKITDDGGTANGGVNESATQTFDITVTPVNDAPTFTKGADQTVLEDSGAQTVDSWATAISAGPERVEPDRRLHDHQQHERGPVLGRAGGLVERHAHLHAGRERVRHGDDHAQGGDDGTPPADSADADVHHHRHRRQRRAELHEGR